MLAPRNWPSLPTTTRSFLSTMISSMESSASKSSNGPRPRASLIVSLISRSCSMYLGTSPEASSDCTMSTIARSARCHISSSANRSTGSLSRSSLTRTRSKIAVCRSSILTALASSGGTTTPRFCTIGTGRALTRRTAVGGRLAGGAPTIGFAPVPAEL